MNPLYDFVQKNRALAKIEKAHSTKSPNLALDDFDLTSLPDILWSCRELHYLNIGHNKLTTLTSTFGLLKNIQHLSVEYNCLERFPEVLTTLHHLKTLNICNNPIQDLTSFVGTLTSLEVLWCNNCCLTSFPPEIGLLRKLETLGARHNKINKLPDELSNLENLKWLTLEDNKLNSLPKNFDNLQNLIHLNLNKNNFSYLALCFTKMKNLKCLQMQNNDLSSINKTILLTMGHVKINLLKNPLLSFDVDLHKIFPNIILPGKEPPLCEDAPSDSDSEDWENSIDSSDLNYSATESDTEDEEILVEVPAICKYLVTF